MTVSLYNAAKAILDVALTLSGIRNAPDAIPEQAGVFPFVACFPHEGRWVKEFSKVGGLHTLILELHLERDPLPQAYELAMGYAETVPVALYADITLGGTVETITQIRYEFGALGWGEAKTIGFCWFVEVKVHI